MSFLRLLKINYLTSGRSAFHNLIEVKKALKLFLKFNNFNIYI